MNLEAKVTTVDEAKVIRLQLLLLRTIGLSIPCFILVISYLINHTALSYTTIKETHTRLHTQFLPLNTHRNYNNNYNTSCNYTHRAIERIQACTIVIVFAWQQLSLIYCDPSVRLVYDND